MGKARKILVALLSLQFLAVTPAFCSDAVELPLTIAATGKLLVDVKINGSPVTCIIDTGSPVFLILDEAIANKQQLPKAAVRAPLRFFAEDRGGMTYIVVLPQLQIGPFVYQNVTALTLDDVRRATGTGYMDLPNFWAQGILGMAFLERFRVKLDYPHQTLTLYPADSAAKPRLYSGNAPILQVGTSNKSLPFLLDTGSTFSIVAEKAMEPLGFHLVSTSESVDKLFHGTARADTVHIGPIEYRNLDFEVAAQFHEYAGDDSFWGIIGYDNLKDLVLDLNFPAKTLGVEK